MQSFCDLAPASDELYSGHWLLIPPAHQKPGMHAVHSGPEYPSLHTQAHAAPWYDEYSGLPEQVSQLRSVVGVHGDSESEPAGQMEHGLQVSLVDCWVAVENELVGHHVGALDPLPQYAPAGHAISGPAALGQRKPAGHRARADAPEAQYAPGVDAHEAGADAPATQKLPAGQTAMAVLDMMDPPAQNEPAGHPMHAPMECDGYEYEPGRHAHEAGDGEPGLETELAGHEFLAPAMQ